MGPQQDDHVWESYLIPKIFNKCEAVQFNLELYENSVTIYPVHICCVNCTLKMGCNAGLIKVTHIITFLLYDLI